MTDFAHLERTLTSALQLTRRPVAVSFLPAPPAGVEQIAGTQPSGCSFWRLAAEGRTFYTVPSDHYNCPVGSYTHHIPLPPEREQELPQVLSLMSDIGYIRMEEVPGVPRLGATPAVIVYAPLGAAPVAPDVVVMAGRPGRAMLLQEAAIRSRKPSLPMLGRPTCMAIPAALSGSVASSLGCIGNRVYTDVTEDEFYTVIAGRDLPEVAEQLTTVLRANAALEEYHRARRATLGVRS
jgi:uncharacterized protein (DUF169 family)